MTNKRKIVNYERRESEQRKGKRGSETVEKKEKKKFRETASESTNPS